jgi:hypothetical protein
MFNNWWIAPQDSSKKARSASGVSVNTAAYIDMRKTMLLEAHFQEGDSPKLLNVTAWQLLNQLSSEFLLQFPFVLGRREAEFDCPDI